MFILSMSFHASSFLFSSLFPLSVTKQTIAKHKEVSFVEKRGCCFESHATRHHHQRTSDVLRSTLQGQHHGVCAVTPHRLDAHHGLWGGFARHLLTLSPSAALCSGSLQREQREWATGVFASSGHLSSSPCPRCPHSTAPLS